MHGLGVQYPVCRPAAFFAVTLAEKTADDRPFGSCVAHTEWKTKMGAPA